MTCFNSMPCNYLYLRFFMHLAFCFLLADIKFFAESIDAAAKSFVWIFDLGFFLNKVYSLFSADLVDKSY